MENFELTSQGVGGVGAVKATPVPVSCLSFPVTSFSQFLVGCEDGQIHACTRIGEKPGVEQELPKDLVPAGAFFCTNSRHDGIMYGAGHAAFVTAVDHHRLEVGALAKMEQSTINPTTPYDFSHLYLSSSFDWTVSPFINVFLIVATIRLLQVKLWSARNPTTPLHTFADFSEYVMDVKWSPAHPGVFACIDCACLVLL